MLNIHGYNCVSETNQIYKMFLIQIQQFTIMGYCWRRNTLNVFPSIIYTFNRMSGSALTGIQTYSHTVVARSHVLAIAHVTFTFTAFSRRINLSMSVQLRYS